MTEQEAYLFDLQGYLVVKDALSASQVADLNAIADRQIQAQGVQERSTHRFMNLLSWGSPYRDLIDPPSILPYLELLLGANVRLDHVYLDLIRRGPSPIGSTLHGGGEPFDPCQFYRFQNGRMHCGLTVVAYHLRDVGPDDGGFACVPGSHKSNFSFPSDWADLSQRVPSVVRRVTGPAGTAIIFTEALTHGALPWAGADERRTVFYKYSPGAISWSANYFDARTLDGLTQRQRAILEPPNARYDKRKNRNDP